MIDFVSRTLRLEIEALMSVAAHAIDVTLVATEALDAVEKCPDEQKEASSYLIIKLMALSEIALKQKAENNLEKYENLRDTIIQICDKIKICRR